MTNKNERLFKPQRGAGVHGDIIDDMKEGGEYYEMILLLDSEGIEKIEKICYNKKAKSLIVESRTRKK